MIWQLKDTHKSISIPSLVWKGPVQKCVFSNTACSELLRGEGGLFCTEISGNGSQAPSDDVTWPNRAERGDLATNEGEKKTKNTDMDSAVTAVGSRRTYLDWARTPMISA